MSIVLLSVASFAVAALVYRQFRKNHYRPQPVSQGTIAENPQQLAAVQRLSTKVPFGKYKNRPVSEMLQDTNYCDWLRDNEDPERRKQYQSFFTIFDSLSAQLFDQNSRLTSSGDTRLGSTI
jgi:hypothetical protein